MELLASGAPRIYLAFVFAFGAIVGSFLNVVIARVPAGESIVHPPSRCPRCKAGIAWFDNVPILSWLMLRARCRGCGLPISPRYPIVEGLTGVLAVAIASRFGPTAVALGYFACAAMLVSLAYIDLDTWLLPLEISLPLLVLGLLSPLWNRALGLGLAGLLPWRVQPLAFLSSAGGALMGALFLGGIAWVGEKLGRELMGWGDAPLFAAIGAWLGAPALLPVLLLASVQGALIGGGLLLLGRALGSRDEAGAGSSDSANDSPQVAKESTPTPAEPAPAPANQDPASEEADEDDWTPAPHAVPFGPFLVLGALEQMLFGDRLWDAWMGLMGRVGEVLFSTGHGG